MSTARPKALDLFCGAGGASMGLHRAGFDVTGIDLTSQPRYPFRFIQANALHPPVDLKSFDFIWASPPCQKYVSGLAAANKSRGRTTHHSDLIGPIRNLLSDSGVMYVIENVPNAPLLPPVVRLCGTSFGLPLYRHRCFETSWRSVMSPECRHDLQRERKYGTNWRPGGKRVNSFVVQVYGVPAKGEAKNWRLAMGIDWMNNHELAESIPPAYSEFIGRQAIENIGRLYSCI